LEAACRDRFGDLKPLATVRTMKIRHHGDYHLGQVLKTDDGFVVIDFEGEPSRPLDERRAKVCPLKDVASMLRSFNYAAQASLAHGRPASATDIAVMTAWETVARTAFLEGYRSTAIPGRASFLPSSWEDALRVLGAYELDKAFYELRYELWNRPDWLSIPLAGIRAMVR
jgi:maltose alpha-D-glucosyltransferase/alpha-amylase